ncbi:hypothetical protein BGZ98_007576, partial [Dissophora globulifera]
LAPDTHKSTYFKTDSKQPQSPQFRCHAWGLENSRVFFVAFQSTPSSYYEYSCYEDISVFMEAYASVLELERCFFEQIRGGQSCNEYYDIDWHIESDEAEDMIALLEQQVFAEFLVARNQHAPSYTVTSEQCRVLSASSSKKLSLHIIIPTYLFENNHIHMKAFMAGFQYTRDKDDDLRKTCQLLK